jgi:tetratricopeptide (TPR) repeat protein
MGILRRFWFWAVLGAVALAGPASADRRTPPREPDFWSEIANPGRRVHDEAMRRGRKAFDRALRIRIARLVGPYRRTPSRRDVDGLEQRRRRLMAVALTEFRRAARAVPDSGIAHYWVGRSARWLEDWKLAISALRRARRLDADLTEDQRYFLSSKLALALSSLGRLEETLREYDLALQLIRGLGPDARQRLTRSPYRVNLRHEEARLLGNSAEFLMALGRLDEALRRYHEALRLHPTETLHQWGLAVAYDRDEQFAKALEYARQAASRRQGMRRLTAVGVSFIPDGELHYYQAMGYLALGRFDEARRQWQAYLEKLPDGPWSFRARAHLAQKAPAPAAIRKHLAPAPGTTNVDRSEHDRTRIRIVVRNKLRDVSRCYDQYLKRRASLAGRLRVSLEVLPDGKLKRTRVVFSTLDHPPLHRCVLKVIEGLKFSRLFGGKPITMEYTFDFKPVN